MQMTASIVLLGGFLLIWDQPKNVQERWFAWEIFRSGVGHDAISPFDGSQHNGSMAEHCDP
jgi:hypothetical protein